MEASDKRSTNTELGYGGQWHEVSQYRAGLWRPVTRGRPTELGYGGQWQEVSQYRAGLWRPVTRGRPIQSWAMEASDKMSANTELGYGGQ